MCISTSIETILTYLPLNMNNSINPGIMDLGTYQNLLQIIFEFFRFFNCTDGVKIIWLNFDPGVKISYICDQLTLLQCSFISNLFRIQVSESLTRVLYLHFAIFKLCVYLYLHFAGNFFMLISVWFLSNFFFPQKHLIYYCVQYYFCQLFSYK